MRPTRYLLSVLLLAALPAPASAQGAVSLNWDTCTGPVQKGTTPGTLAGLVASVLGHGQPHQAYQVFVNIGSSTAGPVRDAWRFDAAGCQGSSLITIDHLNNSAVAKTCPSFQGPLASIQIKEYSYDPATGRARAVLANTYPAGNTTQVNPAQRYFLARFLFDHTFSANGEGDPGNTCGGLEAPLCFHLTNASWLTPGGVEVPWALAGEFVTSNDPTGNSCFTVAAAATTWGAVKAQYKR